MIQYHNKSDEILDEFIPRNLTIYIIIHMWNKWEKKPPKSVNFLTNDIVGLILPVSLFAELSDWSYRHSFYFSLFHTQKKVYKANNNF